MRLLLLQHARQGKALPTRLRLYTRRDAEIGGHSAFLSATHSIRL